MPSVREDWSSPLTELTQQLMDFNSEVWKLKKESGLSLREDISGISIPDELKPFEEDLTRMHRLAG